MSVIEIEQLSKLYGFGDATTVALDAVDLTVEKGEFIAIMGPSGSGKTTLMNILGLLDRTTSGSYKLSERNVSRLRPNRAARVRRDSIGFIFQQYNLLPRLTAIENVALPLAYSGVPLIKRLKKAEEMLSLVELNDRQYYLPHQLSGGQTQRVAVARALINNPSIILADEPTGNLDTDNSKLIMDLLKKIHAEGKTVLMVTHNAELTKYADRVIYLLDGHIEYDKDLRTNEVVDMAAVAKAAKNAMTSSKKRARRRPKPSASKRKKRSTTRKAARQ